MRAQTQPKLIVFLRLIITSIVIVIAADLGTSPSIETTRAYAFNLYSNSDQRTTSRRMMRDDSEQDIEDHTQTTTGSITGRVTAQADGHPLAGIQVLVGWHGDGVAVNEDTYTDANGVYTVTNLYPGNYVVVFGSNPGYQAEYYHDKIDLTGADSVTVMAGEVTSGIDEALVVKTPIGKNVQVTTSPAIPNMLLVSREDSPVPLYSWDGGLGWLEAPYSPWASVGTTPQVALVPRIEPPNSARFIVAEPSIGYPHWFNNIELIGLYRSGDYGKTWAHYSSNFQWCHNLPQYYYLEASSADPHRLYLQVYCYISVPIIFYQPVSMFFTSADAGLTWSEFLSPTVTSNRQLPIISPILPSRIYHYQNDTGWRQSDNNGQTWTNTNFPDAIRKLVLDGQNSQRLYGLQTTGFYSGTQSMDGGSTWQPWSQQPCPVSFLQLLAHPTATGVLLMRCSDGLYRSRDGGDSWQKLSFEVGASLASDYGTPGRVLWVKDDDLWASTDQGTTWSRLSPWNQQSRAIFLPSLLRP